MAPCSPKHLSPLTAGYKRKTIIEPFKIPPAKHSKTLDNADLSEKFCAKSPVFERTALRKALTDPIRASPEPAAGFKRKTIEPFNLPPAKHSKTEDRGDLSEKFCAKSPVFEKAALRDAVTDTIRATPEPTAPVTEASLVREDCTAGRDALAALREKHLLKRYADNSDTPSLAHATTLTKLRDNPVRFVPATHLTLDDERRLLGEFYLVRTPPPEQPLDQRSEQLPVQPPVKPQKQAPVQEAVSQMLKTHELVLTVDLENVNIKQMAQFDSVKTARTTESGRIVLSPRRVSSSAPPTNVRQLA